MRKKIYSNIQLQGMMQIDEERLLLRFDAADTEAGEVRPFKRTGTVQMLSDGTFEYVPCLKKRLRNKQIKKLRHGTVSKTHDDAYLLILRVPACNVYTAANMLMTEAREAAQAIIDYEYFKLT